MKSLCVGCGTHIEYGALRCQSCVQAKTDEILDIRLNAVARGLTDRDWLGAADRIITRTRINRRGTK